MKCGFRRPSLIKHPIFEEVRRLLCSPLLGAAINETRQKNLVIARMSKGEDVGHLLCTPLGDSKSPSLIGHPQKCAHTLLERPPHIQGFTIESSGAPRRFPMITATMTTEATMPAAMDDDNDAVSADDNDDRNRDDDKHKFTLRYSINVPRLRGTQ